MVALIIDPVSRKEGGVLCLTARLQKKTKSMRLPKEVMRCVRRGLFHRYKYFLSGPDQKEVTKRHNEQEKIRRAVRPAGRTFRACLQDSG